ncbi:hypothetical protein Tco_1505918 [Tanacetum coccineum]
MQISSFMSSHKCPELSKRFSDNIPKTVDEMLKRLDDYLWSEEAFRNTESPKGDSSKKKHRYSRGSRTINTSGRFTGTTAAGISSAKRKQGNLNPGLIDKHPAGDRGNRAPTAPATANADEAVRNSFGVRQAKPSGKGCEAKRKRRRKVDECPSNISTGLGMRPLGGSFAIRARLVETHTTVSGFSGEQVKPLGKIELDVCFGGSGLCRREIMKFTIIPAPSPYNIVLGRPGIKQLRAIPSTIHGMMKFPTPWGVATLISQAPIVFEYRRVGKKQAQESPAEIEPQEKVGLTKQVLVNPAYLKQLVTIGKGLSPEGSIQLKNLLKRTNTFSRGNPQI